jgi:subtilisin family serine protease
LLQFRRAILPLAAIAALALAPTATAGKPSVAGNSTNDGYQTWDSDLVDIDQVSETGAGVYVAVLDTGLVPNWSDYFPTQRVATQYGAGFYQQVNFSQSGVDPCGLEAVEVGGVRSAPYIGSRGSSHGTHVASTVIGYNYYSHFDAAEGYPLPPIAVRGIAPEATIIPVKVLADYQIPRLPKCDDPNAPQGQSVVFGTSEMVAAGIDYVTGLKQGLLAGHPIVINMSLGSDPDVPISDVEKGAIDRAIAAGVIVVAAAGNDGEKGMGAPGSYAPVISAGALGWTGEWLDDGASGNPPANGFRYRMWWLQNTFGPGAGTTGNLVPPLFAGSGDVTDEVPVSDVYVTDFSAREHAGEDLDVLAPGSWVRGPFPATPGYTHLPWWSNGLGDFVSVNPGNFFYVGGTSMASPHVASVAALLLQKDPSLVQTDIESILEASALSLGAGSRMVWDPFNASGPGFYPMSWGADATGAGVLQADAALSMVP